MVDFVAATNRKADRAGVTCILEPVKSRFITIIELTPGPCRLASLVSDHRRTDRGCRLYQFRPALLHDFKPTADMTNTPSPRTVFAAARLLAWTFTPDFFMKP